MTAATIDAMPMINKVILTRQRYSIKGANNKAITEINYGNYIHHGNLARGLWVKIPTIKIIPLAGSVGP